MTGVGPEPLPTGGDSHLMHRCLATFSIPPCPAKPSERQPYSTVGRLLLFSAICLVLLPEFAIASGEALERTFCASLTLLLAVTSATVVQILTGIRLRRSVFVVICGLGVLLSTTSFHLVQNASQRPVWAAGLDPSLLSELSVLAQTLYLALAVLACRSAPLRDLVQEGRRDN